MKLKLLRSFKTLITLLLTSQFLFAQEGTGWNDITTVQEQAQRVHLQNYEGSLITRAWNNGDANYMDTNGATSSNFNTTNSTSGYSFIENGVNRTHTFSLFKFPGNRSEIRIHDDYVDGTRQFEGFVTINDNVFSDNAVFQIFGGIIENGVQRATLLQIRGDAFSNGGTLRVVSNGTFDMIGNTTIATNILNQEVKINVIHEQQTATKAGKIYFFVNGVLRLTLSENFTPNNVDGNYFKYGCYGREDEPSTNSIVNSQVQWRNVRLWEGGTYAPSNTPNPAVPTGLSASIVSPTAVNLSWTDVSHDTGYTLQVSTTSATTGFSDLTTTNFNVKTFQATGLTAGIDYWFRVRANGVSNSAFSNAIFVNTTNMPFANASNAIWQYNFGTQAATFTVGAATYTTGGTASGGSNPLTSPGEGQSATIRVNSNANGGFRLVTSGTNFTNGSNGARLAVYPATGGSVNKFYITNIGTTAQAPRIATNLFSLSMNVKFVFGTNGTYQLLVGDGGATTAGSSGSNLQNTDPVFAVIRWQPQSNGNYNFATRVGATSTYTNISGVTLSNGTEFNMRMFCNNSAQPLDYTIGTQSYTVTAGSYHIWINNTRLTTTGSNHNFSAAGLSADAKLDFISLIVNNNSNADGEIILDDLRYANFLADLNDPTVLPVSLIGFDARRVFNSVSLNWSTASESDNARFEIERANDDGIFVKIGEKEGADNSNSTLDYHFIDNNPFNGNNYYRLKQIDFNGKYEYFGPRVVNYSLENLNTSYIYKLSANEYHVVIHAISQHQGTLSISNLNGQKVYEQKIIIKEGENTYPISLAGVADGIYLLNLSSKELANTIKFVKQP
ncbi:fibronectin type III domain-containing protein [Pedobacter glucosidilyticus]|uniref:fibronectin type III domain-containing protein n=1 Tax=Pedobacter glucosidilyticus TaxID=1122941 RepID=UPI0003FA009B|nr:fibronectin type III domain-containing protein [Pedobacter glucosidilyticus]